jgi:flagellar biogenesis protein FliO
MENMYLSVLKMLLVMVAFCCAAVLFYRYGGRLKLRPVSKNYGLQKVETIHLGYKKFVSVVEIKDRVLVIGVGEKELSLLADWKNEEKTS